MRNPKFRAWDKVTKKWIAKDFHVLGEVTCFDLIGQYLSENKCGAKTSLERLNDVELQECTGLKDCNENWIYEGDIIAILPCSDKELWKVGWESERARFNLFRTKIKYGTKVEEDYISEHSSYDECGCWIEWEYFRVVGNIFENKELLNEQANQISCLEY